MLLRIVNPNTTATMTDKIATAARAVASPSTTVEAATSANGPASIEGFLDGALSVPGLLAEIRAGEDRGAAAHVIACFDDTGLDAARSLAAAPVVGIGEAAYHTACFIAGRFSVVTTLARSVPVLQQNIVRYGLSPRCVSVRASGVPVLDLEKRDAGALRRISAEIDAALAEGAEAIVLGCAGMADLAAELARQHDVPVVEGVAAAVKMAEALAALGLRTAKAGGWAFPIPKPYRGMPAFDAAGQVS
jgi:allantoin racemase